MLTELAGAVRARRTIGAKSAKLFMLRVSFMPSQIPNLGPEAPKIDAYIGGD
jgi:hypothetical protein